MQIPSECSVAEDLSWGVTALVAVALLIPLLPMCAVAITADRMGGALCRTR